MTLPCLAALLLVVAADPSPDPRALAVPPADAARAEALVGRLASDRFADRDAASRDLGAMGRLALPALTRAAADSPDPEVRLRCELLLPRAAALDFEARLAAFLADADGKYEHDLPGWPQFRELTRDDPSARPLFAELLRSEANRRVLAGFGQPKGVLAQRVIDRRLDLYARAYPRPPAERSEPTLEDAVTVVFCEAVLGDPAVQVVGVRAMTPYMLLTRPPIQAAITGGKYAPAVRRLVVAWLDTRATPAGLAQASNLSGQLQLKEGVKYAVKLIRTPGASALHRATGATTIAKLGGRLDAKYLVPLFADETVVYRPGNGAAPIELRDVALAMAAHLTGRSPEEFGMRGQAMGEYAKYYYHNYSFGSEADRAKGLAKWAELEPKLAPQGKK